MPIESIWWKYYRIVYYCTSLPNSVFSDIMKAAIIKSVFTAKKLQMLQIRP